MLRRRGVGLLGTVAVGGAAYAAGSSAAKGQAREQSQEQRIAELEAQSAAQNAPPPQSQQPVAGAQPPTAQPVTQPAPGSSTSMDAKIEQLQKLAELKAAGVLTDAELEAQKQRILAT